MYCFVITNENIYFRKKNLSIKQDHIFSVNQSNKPFLTSTILKKTRRQWHQDKHLQDHKINDYSGFAYIKKYRGQATKLIVPDESEPEDSVDSDDNVNMYWSGPGHC